MAAPLFSRAVPASTRMSIIKMSRQDLMPNLEPELVPEQRLKLSLDFRGRKRSFYLPVWLLVLLAAAVIVLLALVGIYGFGGGNAADARLVKELRQQNKYLGSRIAEYEIELDSLASLLDSLGFATSEEQDYPYYSGRDEEARSKLRGTPDLAKQLNSLDRKLSQLWDRLGVEAPLSTGEAEAQVVVTSGDGIPSIYPTFGRISDGWGMRLHPITEELELHQGIDIANQVGTPIYATADGVVDAVAHDEGLGKFIRLNHAKGYQTIYGHLLNFRVKPAEQVRKGQIIALMGNTGLSTGPHLHYGVRKGGQAVNPASYLNRLDDHIFATR